MTYRLLPVLLILLLPGAAPAQDDQKNTTHVRVHPQQGELEVRAHALVAKKDYAAALDLYEEAVRDHPGSVVRIGTSGGVTRHLTISAYAREKIAAWPAEGLDAYRRRYDTLAQDRFERARRAGDVEALVALRDRFPFCTAADDWLALAANLLLDRGEPDRAARMLEEILDGAPPLVRARLGQAYALAGEKEKLDALVSGLPPGAGDGEIFLGERAVRLGDFLKNLARDVKPRAPVRDLSEIPSWPMPGGDPSGTANA
ncbi:MAG: hypothetical protein ACYTAF_10595, partial [Planctomycetota bacterium]